MSEDASCASPSVVAQKLLRQDSWEEPGPLKRWSPCCLLFKYTAPLCKAVGFDAPLLDCPDLEDHFGLVLFHMAGMLIWT